MVKKIELLNHLNSTVPGLYGDAVTNIADYLEQLMIGYGIIDGERLELPCLSDLAQHLQARQMIVHEAFQVLRKRGYDYAIHGLNTPLVFWKQLPELKRGLMP